MGASMARLHPCNALSWLHVEAEVSRQAMQQQLRLRDEQLAADPHASGEPPAFQSWAIEHLRPHATQPAIAQQIEARRLQLQAEQRRLAERLSAAVAELEVEAGRIDDALQVLDQLEAGA